MVVFTCGHCGESVQKPKVEKHYLTKCRNRNPNLSCMDCFKDFLGKDYEAHTKCITEEQRYSGKGYVAKEKKGELKQNAWVEMVQNVLDEQKNASANVLRILNSISKHTNTPRKKPKFINFVKNVCGNKTNPKDIDAAWDLISVKLSALSNNQNRNQNQTPEKKTDESLTNGKDVSIDENINGSNLDDENEAKLADVNPENGIKTNGVEEKKSKKQLKKEKKQQKYEAELQSAGQVPDDDGEEDKEKPKKEKKKNKDAITNGDSNSAEEKSKKKRKRLDTTNSVTAEANHDGAKELSVETLQINSEKTKKKKAKIAQEEEEVCLHDQNVANGDEEETSMKPEKFNWHAVIVSVLQKKGNEMPFKRLQKKVLTEYSEATGREVDDRIAEKLIKKLKSAPNVKVDKNRVLLVE